MSYTSNLKSNRRKPKSRFVPKPKQEWRVKEHKLDWLDLPYDVMANILHRVGVIDILENAQKVCTTWRSISKDPAMWRVIYMDYRPVSYSYAYKQAVDRSQGQLVDLTIVDFSNYVHLLYIADRSSQLRRLYITNAYRGLYGRYEFLKKFPLLEGMNLFDTSISVRDIEIVGRFCPMLRSLKVNHTFHFYNGWSYDGGEESLKNQNKIAIAIGEKLHELRHLELVGNPMTNIGLQVILDGCHHLESLDLSGCSHIHLKGNLGKICSEKIKCLKL